MVASPEAQVSSLFDRFDGGGRVRFLAGEPRFANLITGPDSSALYEDSAFHGGRATLHATSAPVAGSWRVGDRVVNKTPKVGQPRAWVCTAAGAPGTWVSEGVL